MLMLSFFASLQGKSIVVELKNSLQVRGKLVSVDQYLNLKLDEVEVVDKESFPQLVSCVCLLPAVSPVPCPAPTPVPY